MGKKSKKKGGAVNKAARKKKLQERREQQLEVQDHHYDEVGGDDEAEEKRPEREYFVGDRVWFKWDDPNFVRDNPNTHRGIVHAVDGDYLEIQPLQSLIDGEHYTHRVPKKTPNNRETYVFPDLWDLTLRFDVGDKVLIAHPRNGHHGYFQPAIVSCCYKLFENEKHLHSLPSKATDHITQYVCTKAMDDDFPVACSPFDTDGWIRKWPTSFRFKVGDKVTFNSQKARGETARANNILQRNDAWTEGKIILVDVFEQGLNYAVYECSFIFAAKKYCCFIEFDDDEHIALVNENPRKRLFDAIEQDCSRNHFNYLTTHFGIDIMAFRDLVLTKAIEFASYNALTWLQHDCKIDVKRVKDKDGNTFLHMIAKSPNARHFFRNFGNAGRNAYHGNTLDMEGDTSLVELNKNGDVWLQPLVDRGDVKALDTLLSPRHGIAWDAVRHDLDFALGYLKLSDSVDPMIKVILDTFESFHTIDGQIDVLRSLDEIPPEDRFSLFKENLGDKRRQAKLITRFYRDWKDTLVDRFGCNKIFCNVVKEGLFQYFQLLYEADSDLFETAEYRLRHKEDKGEFINTNFSDAKEYSAHATNMDLINACILGGRPIKFGILEKDYEYYVGKDFEDYASDLLHYFINFEADSCPPFQLFLSRLSKKQKEDDHNVPLDPYSNGSIAEYRLRLLEDEKNVEGRRNILEYLLHKSDSRPDILFPLVHRQCWALRVMVETKSLELDVLATTVRSIVESASKLSFLDSGHIPSNMTVRCCLAFAAVQYDDLQSLEWLCESVGPPLDLIAGWNLLHYSAFMGRLEIIGWLSTQSAWRSLVPQMCTRKDLNGAFAVHIAVSCGHLHVCELLIGLGVPLEDKEGKLPEEYAQHSQHEFVREWATERANPAALLKDVKKLLHMINECKSSQEILEHIFCTGCLDIDTWRYCGCETSGRKLGDISFQDVVFACCKYPHIALLQWIIIHLHFNYSYIELARFGGQDPENASAEKQLHQDGLISFAEERGYHDLAVHLQSKWFKIIACRDPMTHEYLLNSVLDDRERMADIRAAVLEIEAVVSVAKYSLYAIEHILRIGGQVDDLKELVSIHSAMREAVINEFGGTFEGNDHVSKHLVPFNMTKEIPELEVHDILNSIYLHAEDGYLDNNKSHIARMMHTHLAIEGHADLLHFCLSNFKGWNAAMELDVVHLASCMGRSAVVDMMLNPTKELVLLSDRKNLYKAAILGAGEGLRHCDLEYLIHMPISTEFFGLEFSYEGEEKVTMDSLIVAVLNGYMNEHYDPDIDDTKALNTLGYLLNENIYTKDDVMFAMMTLLSSRQGRFRFLIRFSSLLLSMIDVLGIQPVFYTDYIFQFIELIKINVIERWVEPHQWKIWIKKEDEEAIALFFRRMVDAGIDIHIIGECQEPFHDFKLRLIDIQKEQLNDWSRFDVIKKGGSLNDIQHVAEHENLFDIRDRGGLLLTHLSAAYDRVDVLEWLIVGKEMDLDAFDAQQRTVLDVAKASKASSATEWIVEFKARKIIGSSLCRNYHQAIYKRRLKQCSNAATLLQSAIRAYSVRKIYANVLTRRMEESQHFMHVWGRVIASIDDYSTPNSWTDIKEQLIDIKVGLNDDMLDETDQKLSRAVEGAVKEEEEENNWNEEGIDGTASEIERLSLNDDIDKQSPQIDTNSSQWLSFQMTSHVVKFLQRGDKKYRSFFVRRMRQLASGERSRILQKPLKGSKTLIYETYLEQKSGHRILWTEEAGTLVIWYIARHKQVSRLMQLIDDSKSRSARQQMPADLVTKLQNEGLLSPEEPRKEVLLDIFGNVPLKVYDVDFSNINEITRDSWSPQLHLTEEERQIVEADGTVLVLGRSGTGKTVCICNRIECDRQSKVGRDPSFTQLFVARSMRLCRYVAGAVGDDSRTSFCTYSRLLSDIEATLPRLTGCNFSPSRKVDFTRFKRDFHNIPSSNEKVSALVLWTVVRTFLKGSIEAFQSPGGILSREDFLEVERLGKNRCRIPVELRGQIYDDFLQYQSFLDAEQLWDDCDRVRHLLHCIKKAREEDPDAFGQIQRSKVYVDEVQDYTQLEILLFFYMCGPNGLFLAGDPAQSVVKGTDFRFEEVRSVGHFVGSTIQKPKTVNVNFRSHSGILNCAGGVLDFLFTHFPGSAKQLKKDRGLFQGSRPGVLLGAGVDELNILLSDKLKGAVVLTHDESARHWRRRLNDYKLVYGIREAKGLEFKTVIILDFYREIPVSLQKPWRELVLGRAAQDFELSHPLAGTYLKLLYTGVTRCIEKLFFVETKSSTAGDASMRWLTKKVDSASYATKNSVNDVEAMSMTSDEYISEGINNAELAQTTDELAEAQLLLDKSIWCFEQTDEIDLAAKARIHYSSVLFRIEIEESQEVKNVNDRAVYETRAAQMIESLAKEGLFFEVLNILSSIKAFLSDYTREELDKRFIRKIRFAELHEE